LIDTSASLATSSMVGRFLLAMVIVLHSLPFREECTGIPCREDRSPFVREFYSQLVDSAVKLTVS
jgi:hypothetical protein